MSQYPGRVSGPPAAVISVGDELLFGETLDSNGSWLAAEMSNLGLEVVRREVVGDGARFIAAALEVSLSAAEVVVVTGGLGPTPDDRTKEAVASFLGLPLRSDPGLLRDLESRYRKLGLKAPPSGSERMALVPSGSRLLHNPVGAAPGLVLQPAEDRFCVLLPGVPREMKAIFMDGVRTFLAEVLGDRLRPVMHRLIHTTGVPESVLFEELAPILPVDDDAVSVAFLPHLGGVRLRLSVRRGGNPEEAEAALDRLEALMDPVLSRCSYWSPSGDLAEAVAVSLLRTGLGLAVGESCTGGLISKRMTDHAGASRFFRGGVVAYSNQVKEQALGVPKEVLDARGSVSREVAEAMALGVSTQLGAEVGIGVTGIAGPTGGSAEKPLGTVWYAVNLGGELRSRSAVFPGDREAVRERAAEAALALLLRFLEEEYDS